MLLLVASCAGYSDAWFPFVTLFEKFWPDCVYERFFYSDRPLTMPDIGKKFGFDEIQDCGWIQNLKNQLLKTNERVVVVFQEDFFLCYPVDSTLVRRLLLYFEKSDYDGLRLYPCPGADDHKEVMPGVGTITVNADYRASCQLMMWKRKSLLTFCDRLLQNGYTRIQQFEQPGSSLIPDFKLLGWIRGENSHPSTWPVSYLCSAIQAGRWMQGALQLCAEHGIPLSKREVVLDPRVEGKGFYEWLESCTGAKYPMKSVKIKT